MPGDEPLRSIFRWKEKWLPGLIGNQRPVSDEPDQT